MRLHLALVGVLAFGHVALAEDWLRYGGPSADFKLSDPGIAHAWPADGPKEIWRRKLGGGYAGILVKDDRLFTMYRRGDAEVVVALDAKSGKTVWEYSYAAKPAKSQNLQFGSGPNASPLIVGDRLFTVGFVNTLHALDVATGKLLWSKDLTEAFGTPLLEFGYASSPVPYKDWIVLLTGGKKYGAVGLEPETGKVAWTAPPVPLSYSTPQVARVDGEDLLVFMAPTEVVAISIASRKIAWRHPLQNQWDTNVLGPWFGDDDLVYISTSGDAGSKTLRVAKGEVKEVASNLKVKSTTGSVIRNGDTVFTSAGSLLTAHDIRSGDILWQERGYKDANILQVGKQALLLGTDGMLTLAKLDRERIEVRAAHQVLEDPALTPPAMSGTKLFLRDQQSIVALELGSE